MTDMKKLIASISALILVAFAGPLWAGNLKLVNNAEMEIKEKTRNGEEVVKRVPATKVVPGTEVIYTTVATNEEKVDAANVAITNPVPAAANVDGLVRVDNTHFYLSFSNDTTLPGIGAVQDEDIVFYNAGTWSVYFDGTARSLTSNNQDIDAFDIVGSTIYFSTVGNTNPPGVGGTADDADIYAWNGTAFSRVFDASANGVQGNANVDGLSLTDATHFYMSFNADTTLPVIGAVQDEDIVRYNAGTWSVYVDGTVLGLTSGNLDLDAIDVP